MAKQKTQASLTKNPGYNVPDSDNAFAGAGKARSLFLWCALLPGIIAFCIYANSLQNGYAFDDFTVITQNELVTKGVAAIPEILSTPYHHGNIKVRKTTNEDDLYRPLSLVMFAAEYQMFGENPFPGHMVNVLLYAGCSVLLFLFLYHLFRGKRLFLAFAGALLFALHPIHTEVVANIKGRDELLCFGFGILSLITFMKYMDTGKSRQLVVGLLLYFLSLLSKETTITFLAVIPLIFFFFRNGNLKRSISIFALSVVTAVIYLSLRYSVLLSWHAYNPSALEFIDNPLVAAPSLAARYATVILVLGYYLRLLFIPYPLISDYGYNSIPYAGFGDIGVWLSFIGYACLLYFGISRLIKKKNDPLSFAIMFFLATIFLFSNVLFLVASELSERFLFIPSVGFCLAAAFAMEQMVYRSAAESSDNFFRNKKVLLILVPIAVVFTWITVNRNMEWKDNFTLFTADSRKAPDNFRLYFFAGNAEIERSKSEEADPGIKQQMRDNGIADYQKSLALCPNFSLAQASLASAFVAAKRLDSAEVFYQKAMTGNPGDTSLVIRLAATYADNHKYREAMKLLKQVSYADPANPYYVSNVATCNIMLKQYDSAIIYLRKTLTIDPRNVKALKFLAVSYNEAGMKDSALKYEAIVQQIAPGFSIDKVVLPQ